MEETSTVIHKNDKANSYEFGKASNRFKLYFEEAADLKKKMDDLKDLGILHDEIYE